jgi:hypothetical protein
MLALFHAGPRPAGDTFGDEVDPWELMALDDWEDLFECTHALTLASPLYAFRFGVSEPRTRHQYHAAQPETLIVAVVWRCASSLRCVQRFGNKEVISSKLLMTPIYRNCTSGWA